MGTPNQQLLWSLVILLVFSSCTDSKKSTISAEKAPLKVRIQQIKLTEQPQILSYSGSIEADNTVSLGFSVSGRVASVAVQEGQYVVKGQLLASVELDTYQNTWIVAGAALEQAQDNFDRLQQLYQKNSLPERDYITAKVLLEQAKANCNIAHKNVQDTRLYASFSGIITRKFIEVGATVAPGVPAFTIVKTDQVYATASITENEISTLQIGMQAQVTIASLNKTLTGTLVIINPQADAFSKTYSAKIRLENAGGILLPGMITDIRIQTGIPVSSITIPTQALVRDVNDINYVFVATDEHTAFKKRVSITAMTGANQVIVSKGLDIGDQLIIEGQTHLEDGSRIQF